MNKELQKQFDDFRKKYLEVQENISNIYKMNVGGQTYQIDPASQGGYLNAYNQYATDRKAQLDQTQKNLDATLAQNNATTNANYDSSARQAYVDYMRKQRALPSQLQALGVRGGATESGLLNMYNNYGVEHAANEQQRNADLTANANNRNDAWNSAYQSYLADLNEQKQQAISNQINEYNNEVTRFSSSVAQYPTTKDGYKQYEAWIENMAASDDPLKDIKVALIRQQMATQFPDGDPNSGGGGGGGGHRRGGGYRGSGGSSGSSSKNSGGGGYSSPRGYASDNSVGSYYSTGKNKNKNKTKNSKSTRGGTHYTTKRNLGRGGIW